MSLDLAQLHERTLLSTLDRHFAERLAAIAGESDPAVLFATAMTRREAALGHICLDLTSDAVLHARLVEEPEPRGLESLDPASVPSAESLRAALRSSRLVEAIDEVLQAEAEAAHAPLSAAGEARPLILDPAGRLYLHRYWRYQTRLANALLACATGESEVADRARLERGLERYFPRSGDRAAPTQQPQGSFDFMAGSAEATDEEALDRQRLAACVALLRRLTVISGGPGTGKTATVVKILALAIEQGLAGPAGRAPRIGLMAPTGKAAATLASAIRGGASALGLAEEVREALPETAVTIHRAIGLRSGAEVGTRHDAEHPLELDWLVVDEASMVDLALMMRLFAAVPPGARVILLGDEHQLASVEAGAVLGDICRAAGPEGFDEAFAAELEPLVGAPVPRSSPSAGASPLGNHVVRLTKSYRYASDRGIGALAAAIHRGDAPGVIEILQSATHGEVELRAPIDASPRDRKAFRDHVVEGFAPYLREGEPAAMRAAFSRFRVLSPVRAGRSGVEGLNHEIESELRRAGLLEGARESAPGRPVLISENDHTQGLYNGDIGFFVQEQQERSGTTAFRVAFPAASADGGEGAEGREQTRLLSPARLPAHEPAFAMTIHKSQGSEFERVSIVISDAAASRVTRQQLYTAVTRAREHVTIHATPNAIAQAVERDTIRSSGLGDALCARPLALQEM